MRSLSSIVSVSIVSVTGQGFQKLMTEGEERKARELVSHLEVLSQLDRPGRLSEDNRRPEIVDCAGYDLERTAVQIKGVFYFTGPICAG